ncbi:MAG TPA: hypothetical protein PKE39_02175 [Ignavibacteria bacterium]|nr:hypothetical protein [Ignavibacteria bacterium]HMQ97807.1 hypothetical protein [Ignavibacteria bacterium]
MEKINDIKISKGYRLSPETHNMIKQIQNILNVNTDVVLNKACSRFLTEIQNNKNKNKLKDNNK